MGVLSWIVMIVFSSFISILICNHLEKLNESKEMAGNANLIIQYLMALHEFGVDSDAVKDFKVGQRDNATFLRRAEVLDHVFREHDRVTEKVDRMWKGK